MIHAGIFKANDIRGVVVGPRAQWDADGAAVLGASFVAVLGLSGQEFVLGHDMRASSDEFAAAFSWGAQSQGAHVVEVGLTSTDELWFASGSLGVPGVQFTASHNPAEYNGVKFCLADAAPITPALLDEIRVLALSGGPAATDAQGSSRRLDILTPYADHVRSLVDLDGLRHLKVVVDAGNGMAGLTVPEVFAPLDCEVVDLYFELDGTFPNHPPNPLDPATLADAQRKVVETRADMGVVFDGDADRCVVIDERGELVSPSVLTAMIALSELERHPRSTIVVNTLTSRLVHEAVADAGGAVVVTRVGHTFVKAAMIAHNAVFGGEHSAHYYFRDFWYADTGIVAALMLTSVLGRSTSTLSELVAAFGVHPASGEINSVVSDVDGVLGEVVRTFTGRGTIDHSDGVTVLAASWWLNVRPSNTESLVRLNVEAATNEMMVALRDEALELIRGKG